MFAQRLVHVGVVARDGGVELGLVVTTVLRDHLGAVDVDFGDLALVCVVEQLGEANGLVLAGTGALDDKLPKEDQARNHEDPDQNLFDGRVQSEFPHFPVLQQRETEW